MTTFSEYKDAILVMLWLTFAASVMSLMLYAAMPLTPLEVVLIFIVYAAPLYTYYLGGQIIGDYFREGWISGRQETGYSKLLLARSLRLMPFDLWLLRFGVGSSVPLHTDPIPGDFKHYRLNIILRAANKGGLFACENVIYYNSRVCLFRPDEEPHEMSAVMDGTCYILSLGWIVRR